MRSRTDSLGRLYICVRTYNIKFIIINPAVLKSLSLITTKREILVEKVRLHIIALYFSLQVLFATFSLR
jgi:hypothetical protein